MVCHATKPGILGFSDLLRKLHEQRKEILIVITAADLLDEEELEEATAVVAKQVETIVSGASIYATSALQALGELDSSPLLQDRFDRLINHLVGQASRYRVSRVFAFLERCVELGCAAKQGRLASTEQLKTDLRALSKALEKESKSVRAQLESISRIEHFLQEVMENLREQSEERWSTSRQEILNETDSYITENDIFTLNNTLSDKLGSAVSAKLDNMLHSVEATLIQTQKQTQEKISASHYSCFVPPAATSAFQLDTSWTKIEPVPEGILPWIFDPDDSKRKSQLRQSVCQKLDTISNHLMEHLHSQINTSHARWNGTLSEIKEEISAREKALSGAVVARKRQVKQITRDVKKLEAFLKQLRSVAVQYRIALLLDHLLFGYYTGSTMQAHSTETLQEAAWVKEQFQQIGLTNSLEATVRSLLKKSHLIELLRVMLVSFVLVAHWKHLANGQVEEVLAKYSIADENLSDGLRDLVVVLRWYALSTDIRAHWRATVEEMKRHPKIERAIVARLYSMAHLSEEEHGYIERAYGHVEPIFSLRHMMRQAVSEALTKAEESSTACLPTLQTDTPPVSPVRETRG